MNFDFEVGDYITNRPGDKLAHIRKVAAIHGNRVAYINETVGGLHLGTVEEGWKKVEETWEAGKWYRNDGMAQDYFCSYILPNGTGVLVWPNDVRWPGANWNGTGMPKESRRGSHEVEVPEWAR